MNVGYYESKRRWWPRLTADNENGLLKHQKVSADSLIICHQGEEFRGFSIFWPLYTFGVEFLKTPVEDRCFYEVIMGNKSQKPYFDIDIGNPDIKESEGHILIEALKTSVLKDSRINEKDILVFSSHGPGKLSYHVVVDSWCLPDFNSNKVYCQKVLDRIPDTFYLKTYVDSLVYKSIQQFRTFGSTKRGKDRYKILEGTDLKVSDKDYRFTFMSILSRSLVSNTGSCRILEYTAPVEKVWTGSNEDLSLEEIKIVENLPFILDGTFEILEVKGRLIPLKRKAPSFCQLCKRVHENENPYLTFSVDSTKIYIHCRRSTNDKLEIWSGIIQKPPVEVPTPKKEVKGSSFMKKFLGKR